MPHPSSQPPRDFDAWAALAGSDPEAFEYHRRQAIDRAIRQAPAHRRARLRGLQWQLDQIRATSRTPMAACLRMQHMLRQSLEGENGLLACLQRPSEVIQHRRCARESAAGVVSLFPATRQ